MEMPNKKNFEVSEFLVANQLKSETELPALADAQNKEGKKDLANFILCRSNKAIQELIDYTWRLQNARAKLDRKKKSRIDLLRDARSAECVDGWNGEWNEVCTGGTKEQQHPSCRVCFGAEGSFDQGKGEIQKCNARWLCV
jgi:hypothetical protein